MFSALSTLATTPASTLPKITSPRSLYTLNTSNIQTRMLNLEPLLGYLLTLMRSPRNRLTKCASITKLCPPSWPHLSSRLLPLAIVGWEICGPTCTTAITSSNALLVVFRSLRLAAPVPPTVLRLVSVTTRKKFPFAPTRAGGDMWLPKDIRVLPHPRAYGGV